MTGQAAGALVWAVAVNVAAASVGARLGVARASGAAAGAAIGLAVYAGAGRNAWVLLVVVLLMATVASHMGLERKRLLGIAEDHEGRRGAGNAIANCGVAAAAAIVAWTRGDGSAPLLALTASLTAGGSDTIASEIGKAWGRSTFGILGFGRVAPGTPGAMSLEGTAAGLLSACGFAALAAALGLIAGSLILAVVVGATAGSLVESVLAAAFEPRGVLNNDALNFINTAVAAAVALALA